MGYKHLMHYNCLVFKIVMFDVEKMKMTEWSKQAAQTGLPRQWQVLRTKVIDILFDLRTPGVLLLHSHDMFALVDTTKVCFLGYVAFNDRTQVKMTNKKLVFHTDCPAGHSVMYSIHGL